METRIEKEIRFKSFKITKKYDLIDTVTGEWENLHVQVSLLGKITFQDLYKDT